MARRIQRARAAGKAAMQVAGGAASGFAEGFLGTVANRVREETDVLLGKVEDRTIIIRDRVVTKVSFNAMLGVAIALLLTAGVIYLQEIIGLANAFLAAGVVMLLIALIYRWTKR